jgi:hypothetical protein
MPDNLSTYPEIRQDSTANKSQSTFFGRWKVGLAVVVLALFLLGALVRLIDLFDQPLDFHPTRQLRNTIVARGLYYRQLPDADPERRQAALSFANSVGQYEPPILESLVALTYRFVGQELPWISRIYTMLFWLVGGLFLFDLARRMTSVDGALIAAGYYFLLPFAVQASRSFQPDPLMVMWFILAVYFLYRWSQDQRWRWVVLAGLSAGIAALVKVVIAYMIGGGAIAIVLVTLGFKRALRSPQTWVMAGLMALPSLLYYLVFSSSGRITEYVTAWTLALIQLIISPAFYVRWMGMLHSLFSLTILMIGLAGVILSTPRNRVFLAGLWLGYLVYGLTLPYQMYTHNYYHLQLTPLLALSLAPVAALVMRYVARQPRHWQLIFSGLLLVAAFYPAWVSRSTLVAEDFRSEPVYWEQIASHLPEDGNIIALTQDYGYRLMNYGWRKVSLWPITGEQELAELRGKGKSFEELFANHTENQAYFLITAFGQFNRQPDLQEHLETNFPIVAEGDGYLIFHLRQPLTLQP